MAALIGQEEHPRHRLLGVQLERDQKICETREEFYFFLLGLTKLFLLTQVVGDGIALVDEASLNAQAAHIRARF